LHFAKNSPRRKFRISPEIEICADVVDQLAIGSKNGDAVASSNDVGVASVLNSRSLEIAGKGLRAPTRIILQSRRRLLSSPRPVSSRPRPHRLLTRLLMRSSNVADPISNPL
jgi:hypothetical protein